MRVRNGAFFALGLIIGTALSLLFLVWAAPEFRSPTFAKQYYENWYAAAQASHNGKPDDAHFWVRELYGWVFAEDSIAQWLMAFLGFAATAISLYALIWLRRTWDQTKRSADAAWAAIEETRRIGEAQIRSYVAVVNHRIKFQNVNSGEILLSFKNSGTTPARDFLVRANGRIYPGPETRYFLLDSPLSSVVTRNAILSAGQTSSTTLKFADTLPEIAELDSGERMMSVYGSITYLDVFGRRWQTHFQFANGGEYGKFIREGPLHVSKYNQDEVEIQPA